MKSVWSVTKPVGEIKQINKILVCLVLLASVHLIICKRWKSKHRWSLFVCCSLKAWQSQLKVHQPKRRVASLVVPPTRFKWNSIVCFEHWKKLVALYSWLMTISCCKNWRTSVKNVCFILFIFFERLIYWKLSESSLQVILNYLSHFYSLNKAGLLLSWWQLCLFCYLVTKNRQQPLPF